MEKLICVRSNHRTATEVIWIDVFDKMINTTQSDRECELVWRSRRVGTDRRQFYVVFCMYSDVHLFMHTNWAVCGCDCCCCCWCINSIIHTRTHAVNTYKRFTVSKYSVLVCAQEASTMPPHYIKIPLNETTTLVTNRQTDRQTNRPIGWRTIQKWFHVQHLKAFVISHK